MVPTSSRFHASLAVVVSLDAMSSTNLVRHVDGSSNPPCFLLLWRGFLLLARVCVQPSRPGGRLLAGRALVALPVCLFSCVPYFARASDIRVVEGRLPLRADGKVKQKGLEDKQT